MANHADLATDLADDLAVDLSVDLAGGDASPSELPLPALGNLTGRWRGDNWDGGSGTLADMVGSRPFVRTSDAFTAGTDATLNNRQVLTTAGAAGFLSAFAFPEIESGNDYTLLMMLNLSTTGGSQYFFCGRTQHMIRLSGNQQFTNDSTTTTALGPSPNPADAGQWVSLVWRIQSAVTADCNYKLGATDINPYATVLPGTSVSMYMLCRYAAPTQSVTAGGKWAETALWDKYLSDAELLEAAAYLGSYYSYEGGGA